MIPATIHATTATGRGYRETPHLAPVGDEPHQRDHRERQLHRQHDLAEHQKLAGAALAIERGDDDDRNDGDAAGDQPPRPVRQAQMQKAFHHDLAGKRRRHRRVQAGGEQRDREQGRGDAEAEQRRQQLERLADFGDIGMAAVEWKVAAATIRIAALMNSASISAMVESVVAHLIASRRPSSLRA